MNLKEYIHLDMSQLEQLDVTELEKERVKHFVLKRTKRFSLVKSIAMSIAFIFALVIASSYAFPTIAAQIPGLNNVLRYILDEKNRYSAFEEYSNELGLVQSSNGVTIRIERAVYDGRNITVSYIVDTDEEYDINFQPTSLNWFEVKGADSYIGSTSNRTVSETQFVGLINYIPIFPTNEFPESVDVTMNPSYFYSSESNVVVYGDWKFQFSLKSIDSEVEHMNKTVTHQDVSFTIHTLTFTDVSTIMEYDRLITLELQKNWGLAWPFFNITDDLGHVYMDGFEVGGGGITLDNNKLLHNDTISFGVVDKQASQLIIKPMVLSSTSIIEKFTKKIELDPIIIELNR